MSSNDSGQGESICTPRRVQKRLFGQGNSSTKRNLFKIQDQVRHDGGISGEESDLGPMSPLAVTDNSCDSSSGREYDSPFTTPDNSPRMLSQSWDRLAPTSSQKKSNLTPFSSLRKLTREARGSPRRRIFHTSPQRHNDQENCLPSTPQKQTQHDPMFYDDTIVPETPQKDYIAETPQKDKFETRLITPLGSVCKEIMVPPLVHRRKSTCAYDESDGSSPERQQNPLKRHATDQLHLSGTKTIKLDEINLIPKARASLFPEVKTETPKLLTLSTKSFYNNNTDDKKRHSMSFGWKPIEPVSRKRHSLPMQNHRRSAGSSKKTKYNGINAGVKHGIKRPKPKRVSRINSMKIKKEQEQDKLNGEEKLIMEEVKEKEPVNISVQENLMLPTLPRAPSPVEDPNKRFFKTNRTNHHSATVTVNEKIKLKVSDGKIALNQKKVQVKHLNKKPKLDAMVFDATDLTVDEPGFNTTVNEKDVVGILQTLEDDWADDEYDTLEPLSNRSPLKSMPVVNNVLLSPATVLSSMTSSMNIEDQSGLKNNQNDVNETGPSDDGKKLFPLFAKGYTSNIIE